MHGYHDLFRSKTLCEVLEFVNSEDILGRVRLLPGNPACPSRKAERIDILDAGLQGEALRSLWGRLKEKEKVVIATLVHSPDGCLNEQQIVARYGSEVLDAVCETDYYGSRTLKGRILLFLYPEERHRSSRTIPEDLKNRLREFVPPLPKESRRGK